MCVGMKRIAKAARRAAFALALVEVLPIGAALADVVGERKVRETLVFIEIAEKGDRQPVKSRGTGFFVSQDGYILTSSDITKPVIDISPDKLDIRIHVREADSLGKPAKVISLDSGSGLLLLKVQPIQEAYKVSNLGSSRSIPDDNKVVWFGFDATDLSIISARRVSDEITGDNWDGAKLLSKNTSSAQIGGPVFIGDGTIVGVLREATRGQSLFIPLQNAAPMFLKIGLDVHESFEKWLQSERGRQALQGWFAEYMKTDGAAELVQEELRRYLHANREKFDAMVDPYMKHIVAYSYSASFELGKGRIYIMPFFKTDDDAGTIDCRAQGPTGIKNTIRARFNDKRIGNYATEPFSGPDGRLWTRVLSAGGNRALFDPDPPGGKTEITPNMRVAFTIDDTPDDLSIGTVTVSCIIQIVGPAKAPDELWNRISNNH
jgi:hypothetical protein